MKVRLTVVMDREIDPMEAYSQYRTTDVYRLAALMQSEALEKLARDGPTAGFECMSVKIEPLQA